MPFKSQAQRRKFAQLLVEGKISGGPSRNGIARPARRSFPSGSPASEGLARNA